MSIITSGFIARGHMRFDTLMKYVSSATPELTSGTGVPAVRLEATEPVEESCLQLSDQTMVTDEGHRSD